MAKFHSSNKILNGDHIKAASGAIVVDRTPIKYLFVRCFRKTAAPTDESFGTSIFVKKYDGISKTISPKGNKKTKLHISNGDYIVIVKSLFDPVKCNPKIAEYAVVREFCNDIYDNNADRAVAMTKILKSNKWTASQIYKYGMKYETSQIQAMRAYYPQAGVIEIEDEDTDDEDDIFSIGEVEFA
jgi:hypothetical protein